MSSSELLGYCSCFCLEKYAQMFSYLSRHTESGTYCPTDQYHPYLPLTTRLLHSLSSIGLIMFQNTKIASLYCVSVDLIRLVQGHVLSTNV